jgi:glycine/D-amino acid oxidase-like deaminating enzyme
MSTSLLQYEIDTPLAKLIDYVGRKNAILSYLLGRDAIYKLYDIHHKIKSNCEFEIKRSIYLSSFKKDLPALKKEFLHRKNSGIDVEFYSDEDLKEEFSIKSHGAIISKDGGQLDAYCFTHDLLNWIKNKGGRIFDKTEAVKIEYARNGVKVQTQTGKTIKARYLVFANGYEAQEYLEEGIARMHSTYVVASEQQNEVPVNYILWETARPYIYVRGTTDNRIIAGGKDEVFYSPGLRDKLLNKKTKQIAETIKKIYPAYNFIPDYCWTGTFAETVDGLPYIGKHKKHPHSYFSICYGGNGITFSQIAAEIISNEILGNSNHIPNVFGFDRY